MENGRREALLAAGRRVLLKMKPTALPTGSRDVIWHRPWIDPEKTGLRDRRGDSRVVPCSLFSEKMV